MAQLNDTLVRGRLNANKIYENGTAIDDKFGSSLELSTTSSAVEIKLKNVNGGELGKASIPLASVSSDVSVTDPTVNITLHYDGITPATSTTNYWFEVYHTNTNGTASSSLEVNSAGYISSSLGNTSTDSSGISPVMKYRKHDTDDKNVAFQAGNSARVYIKEGSITYGTTGVGTQFTTANDSSDKKYINLSAGYYPNTFIQIGTALTDFNSDATANFILNGYNAYDEAANKITGTIPVNDLALDTYFTTTNTGLASLTTGNFINKILSTDTSNVGSPTTKLTRYLKKGSVGVTLNSPVDNGTTTGTTVTTKNFKISGTKSVTPGWTTNSEVSITEKGYTVRDASNFSLAVSSISGSSEVSVGSTADNDDYLTVTANDLSVTATASASTQGWFSSTGSKKASNIDTQIVGKIKAAEFENITASTASTAVSLVKTGGYSGTKNISAITIPSGKSLDISGEGSGVVSSGKSLNISGEGTVKVSNSKALSKIENSYNIETLEINTAGRTKNWLNICNRK